MSQSSGPRASFHHTSLASSRSIRLLHLYPAARFSDGLEVQVFEISIDDVSPRKQEYEALSYVWGARKGTRPISYSGKQLLVTPNCESALQHLRAKDRNRLLWIDAICIDQDETTQGARERNTQVPLMGEIYSGATHTLCWLGEGTSFTSDTMRILSSIARCPSQRGVAKLTRFEDQLRKSQLLNNDESCLDHVFCHPWHSRIWTVQEVAYSGDCSILCGGSSLPWEEYRAAAEFLIYEQFIESLNLQAAKSMVSIDMRNVLRGYLLGGNLEDEGDDSADVRDRQVVFLTSCLTDVNQLLTTDPKDKIYGLYAVYTGLGITLPTVDYNKSLAQVYEEAALAMITWSGSLKILRDACSIARDPTLPSWVPDWHDSEVRLFMPDSSATNDSRVPDTTLRNLSPASRKLLTRGKVIGVIGGMDGDSITMPFPTRSNSCSLPILTDPRFKAVDDVDFLRLLIDKIRFFRELLRFLRKNQQLCQGEDPQDIFYELVTLGRGPTQEDRFETLVDIMRYPEGGCEQAFGHVVAAEWKAADPSNASSWTAELMHCATIAASLLSNSIRRNGAALPSYHAVLDLVKEVAENLADQAVMLVRSPRMDHPMIGTTFGSAVAGDHAVLLEGADWPVVLRPQGGDWRFIGPAFVMGIMDGEAWALDDDDALGTLEDFILI